MDKKIPTSVREMARKNLSSDFTGGYELGYDGSEDLSLSFIGGNSSFADEGRTDKTFSITVKNLGAAAVDRLICLFPGFKLTAADIKDPNGNTVDAIIADGTIIDTADKQVTCNGKPGLIKDFVEFLRNVPTRFTGVRMLVNNSDQFEEDLTIQKLSPFVNLGATSITPGNYKTANQTDDKRVEIPLENFQLDSQTVVTFNLKAGREVTFTFAVGAMTNSAAELNAKAEIARKNLSRKFQ